MGVPILGNVLGFLRDFGNAARRSFGQQIAGFWADVGGAFGRALVPPAYGMGPEQVWGQPPPGTHFGAPERIPSPGRMATNPYGNAVGSPPPGVASPRGHSYAYGNPDEGFQPQARRFSASRGDEQPGPATARYLPAPGPRPNVVDPIGLEATQRAHKSLKFALEGNDRRVLERASEEYIWKLDASMTKLKSVVNNYPAILKLAAGTKVAEYSE
jgi:hypothetical protein